MAVEYGKRVLLKQYKNGNKLWGTVTRCAKCDGCGKVIWTYANGICFDCSGKGWYYDEEREYTPENLAKKEAKRAARRAAQEAEQAAREAELAKQAEEEARREAERLAEIERNRGQFIGAIGDKIEMTVTLANTFQYEVTCYGAPWKTDLMTGYVFKTDDNNTLVWKTTGTLARKKYAANGEKVVDGERCYLGDSRGWYIYEHVNEGDRITIKGAIKGHEEYNNVNQTILTRVKWIA